MKTQWLIFMAALATVSGHGAEGDDNARAEALKNLQIENGVIVSATRAGSPPCTMVKLELRPAAGSLIRAEVWLPDAAKWNGKFIGLGNGGSAGNVNANGLNGPVSAGYAGAACDMGTTLGGTQSTSDSGIGNPEVWRDFGHRATHLMTVSGKQLAEKFYGRAPGLSFFNGSSTGGQQALSLAQRYPEDYDGILAGVPAHCRTPLHAYFVWNEQILKQCPFTKEQADTVVAATLEHYAQYQTVPGAAGKIIADPRWTDADIEAVVALARQKDATLTVGHGDALRKLFTGPRNSAGERIFNGIPPAAGFAGSHGGGYYYLFRWVFGKNFDPLKFDFDKDMDTYTAALAPQLNAENDDLSAFKNRGGKLLMYSGAADPVVPWHATADYYERVCERFGVPATREFFRYYVLPGWGHGGGTVMNRGVDFFSLLVKWRETGEAPGAIHCQRQKDGQVEIDATVEPYTPSATHAGAERVAERFRPPQNF